MCQVLNLGKFVKSYHYFINEKKLIDSNKYRHIRAREIIAIDHPWYKSFTSKEKSKNYQNWIIFFKFKFRYFLNFRFVIKNLMHLKNIY